MEKISYGLELKYAPLICEIIYQKLTIDQTLLDSIFFDVFDCVFQYIKMWHKNILRRLLIFWILDFLINFNFQPNKIIQPSTLSKGWDSKKEVNSLTMVGWVLKPFASPNVATSNFMIIDATSCCKDLCQFMDTLALDCEKISIVETWWMFCNHYKWCKRDGGFYNLMQLWQSFLFIILNIIMWKRFQYSNFDKDMRMFLFFDIGYTLGRVSYTFFFKPNA